MTIESYKRSFSRFISCFGAFAVLFLLLRLVEIGWMASRHVLPDGAMALYLSAFGYDLLYLCFLGFLLALIYLPVAWNYERLADTIISIIMGGILLLYAALLIHYASGLSPLGKDLLGYTLPAIIENIYAFTAQYWLILILSLITACLVFFGVMVKLRKKQLSVRFILYSTVVLIIGSIIYGFHYPENQWYERESEYHMAANKASLFSGQITGHLASETAGRITRALRNRPLATGDQEFPFWREADYTDVLQPYLNTGGRSPNLVFVLVEGLGGSFMPPHAPYGGFTPFLDSLAGQSLYWTHFLAASGNSPDATPSILGSLPYGETGFLNMGSAAPDHETLISILNNNNYHTSFRGNPHGSAGKFEHFLTQQESVHYPVFANVDFGGSAEEDSTLFSGALDLIWHSISDLTGSEEAIPRLEIIFETARIDPHGLNDRSQQSEKYRQILAQLETGEFERSVMERYPDVFTSLLSTDERIRQIMEMYRQRDDYQDTIFIITGSHRPGPIHDRNRIDRYYVPFLIYSPKIRQPQKFHSVSSHLNVPHTLLSHLKQGYGLEVPEEVHWLADHIDMQPEFRSQQEIPFMRSFYRIDEYLSGDHFLSGNRLFRLEEGMNLTPVNDPDRLAEVREKVRTFRKNNHYVIAGNKLMPTDMEYYIDRQRMAEEQAYFMEHGLLGRNPEVLFEMARYYIFEEDFQDGRIILRRLLRDDPGNPDVQLLYGRTFGWQGEYDKAEEQFLAAREHNPGYADVYNALADIYYWQNRPDKSLEYLLEGLKHNDNDPDLLFRIARAYDQRGDIQRARRTINLALENNPDHSETLDLEQRLQ
jgi:lipoteichoic acid synthase